MRHALMIRRIRQGADGLIDPAEADRDWDRNTDALRARIMPRKNGASQGVQNDGNRQGVTLGFLEVRTERERKLVERVELENQIKRRDLVPMKEVIAERKAVADAAASLFSACMDLPDRLAPELAGLTDAKVIRELLKNELRRAFSRFVTPGVAA